MLVWIWSSVLSALIIALGLWRHPQAMKIMDAVWIINALYGGILILVAYFVFGRQGKKHQHWERMSLNTLHCGAGCTLADIIGLFISEFIAMNMTENFIVCYILALFIGVFFQYTAMREMDHHTETKTLLKKAALSDFWSLTTWQIGMLVGQLLLGHFITTSGMVTQIFIMQMAMIVGFIFAYPMNVLLVQRHIKSLMH